MPKNQKALKRARSTPKGRRVDPQAREDVLALLGDSPRRRDLLIEHLHKIQDRFGCLSAPHLVALAAEMKMAMAEVYEVATFYHHFDVVKEGEPPPPAITVRVCDSIACEMAGSRELLAALPALLGRDVRVMHAPCVGRCETAPVAVVGQNPVPHANAEKVAALVQANAVKHPQRDGAASASASRHRHAWPHRLCRLSGTAADTSWRDPASPAQKTPDGRRRGDGRLGPARPRRRRLSNRPQVEGGGGRSRRRG